MDAALPLEPDAPRRNRRGRRSRAIGLAKLVLPAGALLLLGAVALWPQLDHDTEQERVTLHEVSAVSGGGSRMRDPRYHSVDQRGRPFTITARSGTQAAGDRVNLAEPKADMLIENGAWLMVRARQGTYMQHDGQLDLDGDTQLYRSDGTTMSSDSATVDTRTGTVANADRTHAEGPFGTLDSQGFTMLDHGGLIGFAGPAHLRLRGADPLPPPAATPDRPPAPPSIPVLPARGAAR